jgi:hypothetical protein
MAESSTGTQADAVEAARAFLRQRDAIEGSLRAERARVLKRLSEIDKALVELGVEPTSLSAQEHETLQTTPDVPPAIPREASRLKKASIAVIAKAILRANPQGLTAAQILEVAKAAKLPIDGPNLHSALYRMCNRTGEARYKGEKGARVYFYVAASGDEEAEEAEK